MEWLREILIAIVITGVITTWLTGFLNQLVPSPARARLALKNCWGNRPQRAEDGFRVVLCWLGKDNSGHDTETVAQAFVGIDGISLVRSARIVSATGAADEWRRAMKDSARAILDEWNADLAIVGLVKQSDAVLSLWFVPRCSEDTLHRGDQPYTFKKGFIYESHQRAMSTSTVKMTPSTNARISIIAIYCQTAFNIDPRSGVGP